MLGIEINDLVNRFEKDLENYSTCINTLEKDSVDYYKILGIINYLECLIKEYKFKEDRLQLLTRDDKISYILDRVTDVEDYWIQCLGDTCINGLYVTLLYRDIVSNNKNKTRGTGNTLPVELRKYIKVPGIMLYVEDYNHNFMDERYMCQGDESRLAIMEEDLNIAYDYYTKLCEIDLDNTDKDSLINVVTNICDENNICCGFGDLLRTHIEHLLAFKVNKNRFNYELDSACKHFELIVETSMDYSGSSFYKKAITYNSKLVIMHEDTTIAFEEYNLNTIPDEIYKCINYIRDYYKERCDIR